MSLQRFCTTRPTTTIRFRSMSVPDDEQLRERCIEYYENSAQLGTALALHGIVDGWEVLIGGRIDDGVFWAEYECPRSTG